MITTAHALLSEEPDCDADRVREVLSGNHLPLHRLYLDRRSGARRARRLQEARADRSMKNTLHRQPDGAPSRICASCAARGEYVDDLARDGHAARGDPAQLGRAWPHRLDRRLGRAEALPGVHAVITAEGHAGRRRRIIPMRLQPLPEFKPYRAAGDRRTTRCAMSASRSRWCWPRASRRPRTRWRRSCSRSSACRRLPIATAARQANPAVRGDRHQLLAGLPCAQGRRRRGFRDAPYTRREQLLDAGATTALTMEPRGVMAQWDAAKGRLTVSGAAKVPFFNRRILAKQIGLPETAIDMIENDVGGGYGARGEFYPEDFLIPFAARHINRPVKWTEDRRENLMAMNHAREAAADIEIACTRDGTILALRGDIHNDMGAYMRTNGAVGAAQCLPVPGRALSRAARQARLASLDDQQDAGRHLSRAGPLRG